MTRSRLWAHTSTFNQRAAASTAKLRSSGPSGQERWTCAVRRPTANRQWRNVPPLSEPPAHHFQAPPHYYSHSHHTHSRNGCKRCSRPICRTNIENEEGLDQPPFCGFWVLPHWPILVSHWLHERCLTTQHAPWLFWGLLPG
jgi:hypothetical protein